MRMFQNALLTVTAQCPPLRNGLLRLLPMPEHLRPDEARWDREYACGGWEWLKSDKERVHNHIIAAYCERIGADASILDVGCGEGVLHEMLARSGYRHYVGVDISQTAISRIAQRSDDRTRFLVANAEMLTLSERFNVIVLNEVLYYLSDPLAVLARLGVMVAAGGCIIVSMAEAGFRATLRTQKIWQDVAGAMPVLDEIFLRYAGGLGRTIRILGAPGSAAAQSESALTASA